MVSLSEPFSVPVSTPLLSPPKFNSRVQTRPIGVMTLGLITITEMQTASRTCIWRRTGELAAGTLGVAAVLVAPVAVGLVVFPFVLFL